MKKVLITGGAGLVGARVINVLKKNFIWLAPNSKELDITNPINVNSYLTTHDFDLVLHLAAFTNVDLAETQKKLCYNINVNGTQLLYNAAVEKNVPFIFISTDFVFDGKDPEYNETKKPKPVSYYGYTKLLAENIIKKDATIVRISYPYGIVASNKLDFVQTIANLLKAGKQIQAVHDSLITPTYLDDIALYLEYFITNKKTGIYHVSGQEALSPYQAFLKLATVFGLNQKLIKPISFKEFFLNKAKRPQNSAIVSKYKFIKTYDFSQGLHLVKQALD